MSIPALQESGELSPGEYQASLDEVETIFGTSTDRRKLLMRGCEKRQEILRYPALKYFGLMEALLPTKKNQMTLMVAGNIRLLSMSKSWILFSWVPETK